MPNTTEYPLVTATHVRELLGSGAENPVLHVSYEAEDGPWVEVDPEAHVNHHNVVARRHEVVDELTEEPEAEAMAAYLELLQAEVERIIDEA